MAQADSLVKPTSPKAMAGHYWEHLQHSQIPSTGVLGLLQSPSIMLAPKSTFKSEEYFLKLKITQFNTSSLLLPDNARRNGETCKRGKKILRQYQEKIAWKSRTV